MGRRAMPARNTCASGGAGASSTSSPRTRAEAVIDAWTPVNRTIDSEVRRCQACGAVMTSLRVNGTPMCYDCHGARYRESFYCV